MKVESSFIPQSMAVAKKNGPWMEMKIYFSKEFNKHKSP